MPKTGCNAVTFVTLQRYRCVWERGEETPVCGGGACVGEKILGDSLGGVEKLL